MVKIFQEKWRAMQLIKLNDAKINIEIEEEKKQKQMHTREKSMS